MKIGIFGGSFNPPHIAHLILAELLFEKLHLNKIIFIPSAIPPHKKDQNLLNATDRLRLTRLAIAENEHFEVSDIEIKRGGTSYTIETVNTLENIYNNANLYLIVGADNIVTFHHWRDYTDILKRCQIVVMNRPGSNIGNVRKDVLVQTNIVDVPHLDISSTEIRQRLREGKSVRYMVPDLVLKEIENCGFYK